MLLNIFIIISAVLGFGVLLFFLTLGACAIAVRLDNRKHKASMILEHGEWRKPYDNNKEKTRPDDEI